MGWNLFSSNTHLLKSKNFVPKTFATCEAQAIEVNLFGEV
jgi:hypothetical protein